MTLFRLIAAALFCLAPPALAQQELLAAKNAPQYVNLRPLTNGLNAVSLMWPLNSLAENRVEATTAALSTILSGTTSTLSAFDAETYREINGIDFGVTLLPQHIMLTMTAPNDSFKAAIEHLGDLLTSTNFSRTWYARQLLQQRPLLAAKSRRPENVMGAMTDFMAFPTPGDGTDTSQLILRVGMPSHLVVRSEDRPAQDALTALIRGLPLQRGDKVLPNATLTDLPKGVIYVPDPDSRETLIYVVKSESFDDPADFVGANLLMDYMGAYQGSEMFRIIRQELRAAYSPATDFEDIGKNRALMALSATVLSTEWPLILDEIKGIYSRVRGGDATDQGLTNNKRRMIGGLDYQFATNPRWGAAQFMYEHAGGVSGQITFPLFRAMVDADIQKARANAADHLPPFDDYLVILIGGTVPPPDAMKSQGYCEQSLSKPLRDCLTQLR